MWNTSLWSQFCSMMERAKPTMLSSIRSIGAACTWLAWSVVTFGLTIVSWVLQPVVLIEIGKTLRLVLVLLFLAVVLGERLPGLNLSLIELFAGYLHAATLSELAFVWEMVNDDGSWR